MREKKLLIFIILLTAISISIYFLINQQASLSENNIEIQEKYCDTSISFSISGVGTCNIRANILANNCNNKTYYVRNSEDICSGLINNDKEIISCDWQVAFGNYTYNLYINDELQTSYPIMCLEKEIPPCPTCPTK